MYPLIDYDEIKPYIKTMKDKKVSEKARSSDGFLTYYKNNPILNEYWTKKRNAFIKRTLAAAIKNDEDLNLYADKNLITRRRLSLLAWAY